VEALHVDHGVHQSRRIERDEAEQSPLSGVPRSAEAQTITGISREVGRALDQLQDRSLWESVIGIVEISLPHPDLLQQAIDGKTTSPQIVGNEAGHAGVNFRSLFHGSQQGSGAGWLRTVVRLSPSAKPVTMFACAYLASLDCRLAATLLRSSVRRRHFPWPVSSATGGDPGRTNLSPTPDHGRDEIDISSFQARYEGQPPPSAARD